MFFYFTCDECWVRNSLIKSMSLLHARYDSQCLETGGSLVLLYQQDSKFLVQDPSRISNPTCPCGSIEIVSLVIFEIVDYFHTLIGPVYDKICKTGPFSCCHSRQQVCIYFQHKAQGR